MLTVTSLTSPAPGKAFVPPHLPASSVYRSDVSWLDSSLEPSTLLAPSFHLNILSLSVTRELGYANPLANWMDSNYKIRRESSGYLRFKKLASEFLASISRSETSRVDPSEKKNCGYTGNLP